MSSPDRRYSNTPRIDASEFTETELDAIRAVRSWQEQTGTRFPSITEILRVLVGIGWTPPDKKA